MFEFVLIFFFLVTLFFKKISSDILLYACFSVSVKFLKVVLKDTSFYTLYAVIIIIILVYVFLFSINTKFTAGRTCKKKNSRRQIKIIPYWLNTEFTLRL